MRTITTRHLSAPLKGAPQRPAKGSLPLYVETPRGVVWEVQRMGNEDFRVVALGKTPKDNVVVFPIRFRTWQDAARALVIEYDRLDEKTDAVFAGAASRAMARSASS